MHRAKHHWKKVPDRIRRPIVLVVGGLVLLCSGLIGWLPGPGGIPLFLLGIAILSSEFEWADRLKKRILAAIKESAEHFKQHPVQGYLTLMITLAISSLLVYLAFFR